MTRKGVKRGLRNMDSKEKGRRTGLSDTKNQIERNEGGSKAYQHRLFVAKSFHLSMSVAPILTRIQACKLARIEGKVKG